MQALSKAFFKADHWLNPQIPELNREFTVPPPHAKNRRFEQTNIKRLG